MLSLTEAIKQNRLREFIAQEQRRGIGPAELKKLERTLARAIREPRSKRRTSHSPNRAGLPGK